MMNGLLLSVTVFGGGADWDSDCKGADGDKSA